MSMEQNGSNQNMPSSSLCTRGCGFYGNSQFDGMCSKCYKDMVKRRQLNPNPGALISPSNLAGPTVETKEANTPATTPSTTESEANTTPSVETASPTVPSVATGAEKETEDSENINTSTTETATASASTENSDRDSPAEKDKKPKKNRCHTCKKKVGLTGFECRCGGLYCGLHRYSDKHECNFDYKELAQEQIRKANPVVVGAKVQKI